MNLTAIEAKELASLKARIQQAIEDLEVCDYCERVSECRDRGLGGALLCSDCAGKLRTEVGAAAFPALDWEELL